MMRAKTIEMGNKLRAALGLPLIEPHHHQHQHHHIQVLGAKSTWHHGPPNDRHHRMHHHDAPFVARLTHALNNLGRWEGRAVAFVIGCGLGVLLRIVYVFAVLFFRSIRGKSDEDEEVAVEYIVFESDGSAPPSYPTAEEEKQQLQGSDV